VKIEADSLLAYDSTTLRIELINALTELRDSQSASAPSVTASGRPSRARGGRKTFAVSGKSEGRLRDVKLQILNGHSYNVYQQKLYFNGTFLADNDKTLFEYKIPANAILQLWIDTSIKPGDPEQFISAKSRRMLISFQN
jgi:hypothetical protein